MKEIQNRELQRVIRFIEGLGCAYAIVTPDAETFTNGLEVSEPKDRARQPLAFPRGEVKAFYVPQIQINAEVGSVQEIAFGKYGAERVRAGICIYLTEQWGPDTYTTSVNEHCVEVLRTA
jgi:hypothetical protein